jgi:acyl dehydratase
MTTTIKKPADLLGMAGTDLGTSDWLEIPQSDIDMFATATHDEQWIHVDVDKARSGPFGGTIAHGYLTLSLLIPLWSQILVIEQLGMAVNYGLNKVRFPAPVPAGAKVRLQATLTEVTDIGNGSVQAGIDAIMECEGSEKPVCIAQMVHRYYAKSGSHLLGGPRNHG